MADICSRISRLFALVTVGYCFSAQVACAEPTLNQQLDSQLELPPGTVDNSPVLQEWLEETPDILSTIRTEPSFPTRLQMSYALFPSSRDEGGLAIGIEDVFIGELPLTVNADYAANFDDGDTDREAYGAHLRYYVLPVGGYVNVAPIVGYRHVEAVDYRESGVQVGFQVKLIPARGGGADFAYTQTWVSPTEDDSVMITQLEFGYGLTDQLRLATDVEWQFAPGATDSRLGIGVEWML
ncbi:hypothetical protein N836_07455 [Leptolyngbya sp. Heron Island J]|uniref:hypothetical protein n=1 Tax=Leptolyngbya sp. Heron Island J TaxID=1385935 RepID=UPI0003B9D7E2|nr:hypothetical protein [Leptolyngbya sp. Heron Island J]ESA36322.1 hypothetical protein N836_07455 [Leptolyngbya sp. Heron Island J]